MSNSINIESSFLPEYDNIVCTKRYSMGPMYYRESREQSGWNFPIEIQNKILNEQDDCWEDLHIPKEVELDTKPDKKLNKENDNIQDEKDNNAAHDAIQNSTDDKNNENKSMDTQDALPIDVERLERYKLYKRYHVRMYLKDDSRFIPYTFHLKDKNCYEVCPYFNCSCENHKIIPCFSKACKFKYSKCMFPNEARLKDGLEIMDIPSTLLETIDKRKIDNQRKKAKAERIKKAMEEEIMMRNITRTNAFQNTNNIGQNLNNNPQMAMQHESTQNSASTSNDAANNQNTTTTSENTDENMLGSSNEMGSITRNIPSIEQSERDKQLVIHATIPMENTLNSADYKKDNSITPVNFNVNQNQRLTAMNVTDAVSTNNPTGAGNTLNVNANIAANVNINASMNTNATRNQAQVNNMSITNNNNNNQQELPLFIRNIMGTVNMLSRTLNPNGGNQQMFLPTNYGAMNMNNITFARRQHRDTNIDLTRNFDLYFHPTMINPTMNIVQDENRQSTQEPTVSTQMEMVDTSEDTDDDDDISRYINTNIEQDLQTLNDLEEDDKPKRKMK